MEDEANNLTDLVQFDSDFNGPAYQAPVFVTHRVGGGSGQSTYRPSTNGLLH